MQCMHIMYALHMAIDGDFSVVACSFFCSVNMLQSLPINCAEDWKWAHTFNKLNTVFWLVRSDKHTYTIHAHSISVHFDGWFRKINVCDSVMDKFVLFILLLLLPLFCWLNAFRYLFGMPYGWDGNENKNELNYFTKLDENCLY